MVTLSDIERSLATFETRAPHDPWSLAACRQALFAARAGTYGVGAVLVDPDGNLLVEGHNHVHVLVSCTDNDCTLDHVYVYDRPGLDNIIDAAIKFVDHLYEPYDDERDAILGIQAHTGHTHVVCTNGYVATLEMGCAQ